MEEAHVELLPREAAMSRYPLVNGAAILVYPSTGRTKMLTFDGEVFHRIIVIVSDGKVEHHDSVEAASGPMRLRHHDPFGLRSNSGRGPI